MLARKGPSRVAELSDVARRNCTVAMVSNADRTSISCTCWKARKMVSLTVCVFEKRGIISRALLWAVSLYEKLPCILMVFYRHLGRLKGQSDCEPYSHRIDATDTLLLKGQFVALSSDSIEFEHVTIFTRGCKSGCDQRFLYS